MMQLFATILSMIVLSCAIEHVQSKKILQLPSMLASHILEMSQVGQQLVENGHEVHMLVAETVQKMPTSLKKSGIKFLKYEVDYDVDPFTDEEVFNITREIWEKGGGLGEEIKIDVLIGERECFSLLKNKKIFQTIVAMNFDYAIVDGFGATLCRYIIPYQAGIPYGSLTAVVWPYMSTIAALPSVTVGLFASAPDRMSYLDRIDNLYGHYFFAYICRVYYDRADFRGSYVDNKPYDSLMNLAYKSQFWIIETEGLMDYNRIMLPHIHYVGGLTARKANPLTGKILDLAEKATGGLILVSFGSRVTNLPFKYISKFFEGLNNINKKYTIIFKYGGSLENIKVAENVHIVSWMPQNDILGHKNTRLFITHCGNNGRYESLYHGVPMLAFPFDADQPINAIALERKGYGIYMEMRDFEPSELTQNIHEMIENPKYKARMQKASSLFKALPNPRKKAAEVVEHVIEHGADHWYMPASELYMHQIYMLDIFAPLVLIVILIVFLVFTALRKLLDMLLRGNKKQKTN